MSRLLRCEHCGREMWKLQVEVIDPIHLVVANMKEETARNTRECLELILSAVMMQGGEFRIPQVVQVRVLPGMTLHSWVDPTDGSLCFAVSEAKEETAMLGKRLPMIEG